MVTVKQVSIAVGVLEIRLAAVRRVMTVPPRKSHPIAMGAEEAQQENAMSAATACMTHSSLTLGAAQKMGMGQAPQEPARPALLASIRSR